jgi:hypothetical protein
VSASSIAWRLGCSLWVAACLTSPTRAADPRHPDWPCRQIKVASLSVAAVWTGPPIAEATTEWQQQPELTELVATVAQRRLPLADAENRVTGFLSGKTDHEHWATLLFAGLFDTLDHERSTVLDAIERFGRKARGLAVRIRSEAGELRTLQSSPNPDQARIDELSNQLTWDTRVYEDRQQTINYVCEVPQLIEQRLFALSRTIQQALP